MKMTAIFSNGVFTILSLTIICSKCLFVSAEGTVGLPPPEGVDKVTENENSMRETRKRREIPETAKNSTNLEMLLQKVLRELKKCRLKSDEKISALRAEVDVLRATLASDKNETDQCGKHERHLPANDEYANSRGPIIPAPFPEVGRTFFIRVVVADGQPIGDFDHPHYLYCRDADLFTVEPWSGAHGAIFRLDMKHNIAAILTRKFVLFKNEGLELVPAGSDKLQISHAEKKLDIIPRGYRIWSPTRAAYAGIYPLRTADGRISPSNQESHPWWHWWSTTSAENIVDDDSNNHDQRREGGHPTTTAPSVTSQTTTDGHSQQQQKDVDEVTGGSSTSFSSPSANSFYIPDWEDARYANPSDRMEPVFFFERAH